MGTLHKLFTRDKEVVKMHENGMQWGDEEGLMVCIFESIE